MLFFCRISGGIYKSKINFIKTVLHITHSFSPFVGGTASRLDAMLQGSKHRHILIVICAPNRLGSDDSEDIFSSDDFSRVGSVDVFYINPRTSFSHIPGFAGYCLWRKVRRRLKKCLGLGEVDIVVGHSPLCVGSIAQAASRLLKCPYIYEFHQLDLKISSSPKGFSIRRWKRKIQYKRVLQGASVIVLQTSLQKESLREFVGLGKDDFRYKIVPMGLDSRHFRPMESGKKISRKVNFLVCGQLSRRWGVELVIEAFRILPKSYLRRVVLNVYGAGELAPLIRRLAFELPWLKYHGAVDHKLMPEVYSNNHCLVMFCPKIRIWEENHPTKLLEAIGMGLPVLATRRKGIKDVGEDNIVFVEDNLNAMRDGIIYVVENLKFLESKSRDLSASFRRANDWHAIRDDMDGFYQDLDEDYHGQENIVAKF